jgi:hypothetical protein
MGKEKEDFFCAFCKKAIKKDVNVVLSTKYNGAFCDHICYVNFRKSLDEKWSENCEITIEKDLK